MSDQDEAAMSDGEEAEEPEREQEKQGLRRRKAGPLRRWHSGCWRGRRGETAGTGLQRLRRQEYVGAFSVQNDAVWRLGRCKLGLNLDRKTQTLRCAQSVVRWCLSVSTCPCETND